MQNLILDSLNIAVWAKDKNFRYLYCNETYASAAGLDSPQQIRGKSDDEMPWRQLAEHFRAGDQAVLNGQICLNVPELEIMVDRVADILVNETQLLDQRGECIGVVGSFVEITGRKLTPKTDHLDPISGRYNLGPDFGHAYLTPTEAKVLKKVLLGHSARQIGEAMFRSPKTIDSHIENLKIKLNANSKGELIAIAIEKGLTHV
jgi:DNA-binding CsgD family transcriptional regulator